MLRRGNDRDFPLNDSRFLARNFFERIAQPLLMIEIDRCDDSDIGLNRVGGVEASAQSCFQNDDVDPGFGEIFQRERGRYFKECRMRLPTGDEIPNRRQAASDRAFRNHFAVDANTFAKGDEVRGDKQAAAMTLGARDRIDHGANGAFAVCAGDMNDARPGKIDM